LIIADNYTKGTNLYHSDIFRPTTLIILAKSRHNGVRSHDRPNLNFFNNGDKTGKG